jgi:pyruvate kinase
VDENERLSKQSLTTNEVKIIAKLENEEAIKDIEEILNVADAILIPRGVLGTVLPIEKISWIQKSVIKFCNHAAKPCILAS